MFWYEEDIQRLEKQEKQLTYEPKLIFYGSSSFTLWDSLHDDFKDLEPVNLGFGGSTLAACVWFFDRILAPYQPSSIVLYAGDNDLDDGRHAEEVYIFYLQFIAQVRRLFGFVPTYFVSIKPSESRLDIIGRIKYANKLIYEETEKDEHQHFINIYDKMLNKKGLPRKELFKNDKLHLSEKGYELWKETILSHLPKHH